ncbi:cytochrome P450 [Myxococcota bacterium]|nr:cytochrome P450 [Myxococcota bacterium]
MGLRTRIDYDPFSRAVMEDPWSSYTQLRESCPVHHHSDFTPPFYTLSRYVDVRSALDDSSRFSMRYGPSPQYTKPSGLVNDPPEHTLFRQLFNRAFTPRVVARLEDEIEELGTKLIGALPRSGEADFNKTYAAPLPTTIIARLLGIPAHDHARFARMSHDLTATYNLPDPEASRGPRKAFDRYFQAEIDERRRHSIPAVTDNATAPGFDGQPPEDLLRRLVFAEVEGRSLEDREIHWLLLLLLLGGNETSTALLTNLLWRLLEVPDRWESVKQQPSLIPNAVEESLRFDAPVLGLFRTTCSDTTLHGVNIPARSKVMLLFASANRDPEIFENPDVFDLHRDPDHTRRHSMTFGFGAHYCPGAALARLEAQITLQLLTERLPNLSLAGSAERIAPFNLWGRARLPVAW